MKGPLLLLITIAFATLAQAQINGYTVGQTVSDFTVTDTDGNSVNLYSITATGKHVFLDFFFVDCPPCQATEQFFSELHDKYGCNEGDIYCLVMNTGQDNNAQVETFMTTYGGSFNHAPAISGDGGSTAVTTAFNPAAYPTYCLIGPDNKLVNSDIWPINSVADFEGAFPTAFNTGSCTPSTGIEEVAVNPGFLSQNHPNPFSGQTSIGYELNADNGVLVVTDLTGKTVEEYPLAEKTGQITMDANLSAGTYFYLLLDDQGAVVDSKKMQVVQ